jgi:adenosylcobinamide-GDP ribazoletransferase
MRLADTKIVSLASYLKFDLQVALLFCTRLPLNSSAAIDGGDVGRAAWAMPIAGAVVGALGGSTYWLAFSFRLPPTSAAMLALLAMLIVTGGLHADGLADTADGFGGGRSREHKLAIMRDSRNGTFGVCALLASFILQWSALVAIAEPRQVALALLAAHVSARATLPAFMRFIDPARSDGLSADAGPPPLWTVVAAATISVIALVVSLGLPGAIVALLLLLAAGSFIGWLTVRQIGGQTGDVLGALEQIAEIVVLLTAVALYRA